MNSANGCCIADQTIDEIEGNDCHTEDNEYVITACQWILLLTADADTFVVPVPMMKWANQNAMILRSECSSSWYIPYTPYIHRTPGVRPICILTHLGIKQRIHSWLSHGDDSSSSLHPAIVPPHAYINPRLSNNQQISHSLFPTLAPL